MCQHVWVDTGWIKPMSPPITVKRCTLCDEEGWQRVFGADVEPQGRTFAEAGRPDTQWLVDRKRV
jgi:hypothetical protein